MDRKAAILILHIVQEGATDDASQPERRSRNTAILI
jgi:hypothetical protein